MGVADRIKSGKQSSSGGVASRLKPKSTYTEATPDEATAHRIYEQQMKKAFNNNPESFLNPSASISTETDVSKRNPLAYESDLKFTDNPAKYLIQKGLGLIGLPEEKAFNTLSRASSKIQEFGIPNAPLIGRREDGSYGNIEGTNARQRYAESNPAVTTGTAGLDTAADITGKFIGPLVGTYGTGPGKLINETDAALTSLVGNKILRGTTVGALTGAPLNAAVTLATEDPTIGQLANSANQGILFGGALGAVVPALGSGIKSIARFGDKAANEIAGNALKNVSENTRSAVKSPFAEGASPTNAIANNYTRTVARTFGNAARNADVPVPTPKPPVSSVTDANGLVIPNFLLRNRRGAEEAAVPPTQPPDIAQPTISETPAPRGIRGNYQNQLDNGNFSPELQSGIRRTDQSYDIATNASSVAKANENVKDISVAESNFISNREFSPEHVATGYRLMQELDRLANAETNTELRKSLFERTLNVANKLAEDLTKAGQTSQAASILSRLSPEGQFLNLVRTAAKSGKTVSEADQIKFKQLAAEVQAKSGAGIRANEFNAILNRLEKGENVTVDEVNKLAKFLSGAEDTIKPKSKPPVVKDSLPEEFKDIRKRDRIVSYLDEAEQAALARIQARKNRLNSLPIDEWKDHSIVVAAQIAKGTIKAATHVEDLVRLFGEEIRPVASQVFQSAQKLVTGVSRGAAEGNLERANQVIRRLSGEEQAEKAIIQETANHVKKLIADAKSGNLNPDDIQKLRDYSEEIADLLEANAKPRRIPSQEERFLQSVKSLAKKIAQVEDEKIPADQANREISSLIRQITKIADEGTPPAQKQPLDNKAISDIAHDVMEKTRPNPKPTTLQEKIVEKYIKENKNVSQKDIETLRELAKNVTRLSGDQKVEADIAMQKILNSYEKSSVWDKLLAIRYMSMLLNTATQMINAASGPIMATSGVAADVLGTMVDIVMSKAIKSPRTTTLYGTNPLKFMARYFKNAKIGAKAGALGVNPAGIQSTNEIRGLAFKSLKNPFGLAERTLGAVAKGADYATYRSVYESEMLKQAYLDAVNTGIKGKQDIKNHIQQFINDPPESAVLQADRIGKNTTFQRADRSGGKAANWLNSAPPFIKPIANTIFPFVRTPVNIASTAVTMTPAGIIKGLYQLTSKSDASRREAIRTLSLGLTGTAGLGTIGFYLEQLGILTGANDSGNKELDNIREQAGRGKYRFNTSALQRYLHAVFSGEGAEEAEKAAQYRKGDKQFDYNKLQPLAFPLAAGASLSETRGESVGTKVGKVVADSAGSLLGMSTLKGLQSAFQPSYEGSQGEKSFGIVTRLGESFFKSFSPGSLAQEARRQDPIQRKTAFNDGFKDNLTSYFKSRTPGLSQSLPARKTTLGQDYKNAPGIKGAYLNPYRSEVAPYNDAASIISDLIDRTGDKTLAPSAPEKSVSGKSKVGGKPITVAIPPDRYAKLQEDVGRQIIDKVLAIPATLSDDKKILKIKDIYKDVRSKETEKLKREYGIRID